MDRIKTNKLETWNHLCDLFCIVVFVQSPKRDAARSPRRPHVHVYVYVLYDQSSTAVTTLRQTSQRLCVALRGTASQPRGHGRAHDGGYSAVEWGRHVELISAADFVREQVAARGGLVTVTVCACIR